MVYVGKIASMVNKVTTSGQGQSDVTALADGRFLVFYADGYGGSGQMDGDGSFDVLGQVYDARGLTSGSPIQANADTPTRQWSPSVATLTGGGYVVSWEYADLGAGSKEVLLQRFNNAGVAQGDILTVNTTTTGTQDSPKVAALSGGGYVVMWQTPDEGGSGTDIHMQRYSANGTAAGDETLVNSITAGAQTHLSVVGLANGGFVATWTSLGSGPDSDAFMRRFDASGKALGAETESHFNIDDDQYSNEVIVLSGGNYVTLWESGTDINMHIYKPNGSHFRGDLLVNNTLTTGSQKGAVAAALPDGGFVVAWLSDVVDSANATQPDGINESIYLQQFNERGKAIAGPVKVNTVENPLGFADLSLASNGDGKLMVTWSSGEGYPDLGNVWQRTFSYQNTAPQLRADIGTMAEGTTASFNVLANDSDVEGETLKVDLAKVMIGSAKVAVLDDNKIAVSYTGANLDPGQSAKITIAYSATDGIKSTNSSLVVTVNGIAEDILGSSNADTLTGTKFGENIYGKVGRDTIKAGAGDDFIFGGQGNDTLWGGAGVDTFVYEKGLSQDKDVIKDFVATSANHDVIRIEGYFTNFNRLHFFESGGSTRIDFSSGNSITVIGVKAQELDPNDFVFI